MIMPLRRSGNPTSLWNNVAVGANGTSNAVELARSSDQLVIYVTTSGATTITLETAHSGAVSSEGVLSDTATTDWGPLYYINTDSPVELVLAGAGSASWIVPDFAPGWIRLRSSAAVTLTAGHEVTSG